MSEQKLRQVIREKIKDVEPYSDVLASVTDDQGRTVEVKKTDGGLKLLVYENKRLTARVNLGRRESQELANALS